MIIINSLASVALDGVGLGNIILAAQNPSVDKDDLLQKLEDWHITKVADAQTTLTKTAVVRIAKVTAENEALAALTTQHDETVANLSAEKEAAIAALTSEKDALQTALTEAGVAAAAALQEKADTLAANEAEVELIRQNTKTAITTAAQYLQALTETELSAAQAAAVAGLGGVLEFASKSEQQRQRDELLARKAALEAQIEALQ